MSLVGFSARNHPQQAVRDEVDDRRTPLAVFTPLHKLHGFTLDAAASDENHLLPRYYTRQTDGLLHSWAHERVWCNPPYSRLAPWFAKAWLEMGNGCELIVMLVPANRTEQRFWQEYVEPYRDGGGASASERRAHDAIRRGTNPLRLSADAGESEVADVRQRRTDVEARGVMLRTHFLYSRLRFDWPADRIVPEKGDRPPFGCVLLTWERAA